jgi:hypothetical protein
MFQGSDVIEGHKGGLISLVSQIEEGEEGRGRGLRRY